MDLGTAVDLAEGYVTKVARPFEKVRDVLRAAIDAEARTLSAEARLAALNEQEHTLHSRLSNLELSVALATTKADEASRVHAEALAHLQTQMLEATQAAQEVIRSAEESAAAKRAVLDADYDGRKVALQAEIEALEARKRTLEDTFATIRASVAAITGAP